MIAVFPSSSFTLFKIIMGYPMKRQPRSSLGLEIRHPYGFVGALPFQDQREGVPFGAEPVSVKTLDIAGRIKTFTEQTNDAEAEEAIRSLIRDADKIIFLGFAFHELN